MHTSEKLAKTEAPIERASSEGERQGPAISAQEPIHSQQLLEQRAFHVPHDCGWQKEVFLALCKKYDIHVYPYSKPRDTSTGVRAELVFFEEVLWPEYLQYSENLEDLFNESLKIVLENIKNRTPHTPDTFRKADKLRSKQNWKATSPPSC